VESVRHCFGDPDCHFVNWFIARHGDEHWNDQGGDMFLSGSIPSLLFIFLLFHTETPRFLVLKRK
jgi:hypothetical protein